MSMRDTVDICKYVADGSFSLSDQWVSNINNIIESACFAPAKNNIDVGHGWIFTDVCHFIGKEDRLSGCMLIKIINNNFYAVVMLNPMEDEEVFFMGVPKRNMNATLQNTFIYNGSSVNVCDYTTHDLDLQNKKYAGGRNSIRRFLSDFNQPLNILDELEISDIV